MSDVFSFRLESNNPREAQAREVIKAWAKQGYSLRHIMTEALLLLGKREANSTNLGDITETVDRLSRLVERLDAHLEVIQADQPVKLELSKSFVSSIKMAAKLGMRINNDEG
jgi:uncharacterized protein (DUF1800 family)